MKMAVLPALLLATTITPPLTGHSFISQQYRNDQASIQIMHTYAQCAVDNSPVHAAAIVDADYRTDAYTRAIRDFALEQNRCVPRGGKLVFQPVLFAGDMAEALMRRHGIDLATADISAAKPNPDGPMVCVVRAQPATVSQLFGSKPASTAEAATLTALQPALASCLPQGRTLATNPVGFRAMLALAAYRLTRGTLLH